MICFLEFKYFFLSPFPEVRNSSYLLTTPLTPPVSFYGLYQGGHALFLTSLQVVSVFLIESHCEGVTRRGDEVTQPVKRTDHCHIQGFVSAPQPAGDKNISRPGPCSGKESILLIPWGQVDVIDYVTHVTLWWSVSPSQGMVHRAAYACTQLWSTPVSHHHGFNCITKMYLCVWERKLNKSIFQKDCSIYIQVHPASIYLQGHPASIYTFFSSKLHSFASM